MSGLQLVFLAALFLAIGSALTRGGRDERIAALAIILATLATPIAQQQRFVEIEAGILLVDMALFAILASLAFSSRRFWPIWATGFQLGAMVVHLTAGWVPHMLPAAYAETLVIWSYPVLAALGVGAWVERGEHRLT